MSKKPITTLLALSLALTMLPTAALAEGEETTTPPENPPIEDTVETPTTPETPETPDDGEEDTGVPETPPAEDGKINSEEKLLAALEKGGEVTLDSDITLSKKLDLNKAVVLDLGGHTLSCTEEASEESVLTVSGDVSVTIRNGTVQATLMFESGSISLSEVTIKASANSIAISLPEDSSAEVTIHNCNISGGNGIHVFNGEIRSITGGKIVAALDNEEAILVVGGLIGNISGTDITGHMRVAENGKVTSVTDCTMDGYISVEGSGSMETISDCTLDDIINQNNSTIKITNCTLRNDDAETYYISVPNSSNGQVIPSTRHAARNDRVTLTVHPDSGYELDTLTVTDVRGREVNTRSTADNTYSFTMPASAITVEVSFKAAKTAAAPDVLPADDDIYTQPFTSLGTPGISGIVLNPSPMPFTDVHGNDWFYNHVDYVWKHYLMSGVSDTSFDPSATTSRAMIWTILARMNNIRTDVNPGATWYERGMIWAMQQGLTDGTDPMGEITREQLATMLWRNASSPASSADLSVFTDSAAVSAYAQTAVRWAVSVGVLNGSDGQLNPQGTATRAEVAAMVARYGDKVA